MPEKALIETLEFFTINTVPAMLYDNQRQRAESLIGQRDPKDAEILALALLQEAPIWTDDDDFSDLEGVMRYRTSDLLASLVARPDR